MKTIRFYHSSLSWFLCIVVVSTTLLFASNACGKTARKLTVYVVNYPLMYFAERIGGEHVNVEFPVPAGVDPAYWTPDIETITKYQQADLILLNGAGYAKWVEKVSLPRSRIVDTSKKYRAQYITIKGAVTHSHGLGGKHAHEGAAFTTWLDFDLAAKQAMVVSEALGRKMSHLKPTFEENSATLTKDLLALDKGIKEFIARKQHRPLVASHPVYAYFAGRYELNVKSLHWEPDELPSDAQWAALLVVLKNHPAKWMVWEGEPMQGFVKRLKAIGVGSLVFDPCASIPDQGDFLSVMRRNVQNLRYAFE